MEKMSTNFKDFISGYSIEVVPNSAAKIKSFKEILPINTRVYIAHLETENIATMVATAKRINEEGFTVMPHIPARIIENQTMLNDWISMYQNEAGVDEALLLAGSSPEPIGDYDSSIQLIEDYLKILNLESIDFTLSFRDLSKIINEKLNLKDSIFATVFGITSIEYPDIKSLKCLVFIFSIKINYICNFGWFIYTLQINAIRAWM